MEDERGHQGTAQYPIHKHRERHGMRLSRTHTHTHAHTHVTTVPARLRSNGLHPSSRSPSTCPGADYETMDGGETTTNVPKVRTNHHLTLLGTRMGGCSMPRVPQPLPANHQRPPPDLSERAGCRASQRACAVPSHVLGLAGAHTTADGPECPLEP